MQFAADGTVRNYDHPNERYWLIEDGVFCLLNEERVVTTRFDTVETRDQRLVLTGRHIPSPAIILCLAEQPPGSIRRPGTKIDLAEQIRDFGWSVGDHTYGHPRFFEAGRANFTVGKYTSMASGLVIALGNHRVDTVSTYPFATLRSYWPSVPNGASDHDTKGDVMIGNDVWIGADAFICSGVTIGDGAVIGAKSVVSRDVPPYGIVVGNPGRVARLRFSEQQIATLLGIRWWDWPDHVVDQFLPLMMSSDIGKFLQAATQYTQGLESEDGSCNITAAGRGSPWLVGRFHARCD